MPQKTDEETRLLALTKIEKQARKKGFQAIAGIDEAGRGPLAGPVVAAACMIPAGLLFEGINDSKQLTPLKRERLFTALTSHPDVLYGVGQAETEEIDTINIYQATLLAMRRALDALKRLPDYLLVDGMTIDYRGIACQKVVGGDAKVHMIAAASVIAKETRDRLMRDYHKIYPDYGFDEHKGYGVPKHMAALQKHGPCPLHRKSFAPVSALLISPEQGLNAHRFY